MDNQAPTITSLRNPRVVAVRKLAQRKHRRQQGRFLVQGLQLLHMGLDGGAQPVEVFYDAEGELSATAATLLARFRDAGAAVVPAGENVMAALAARNKRQEIIATFALWKTAPQELTVSGKGLVVVLDRLQYANNVGMLLRVADAVGAEAVILLEPTVDLFDPRAVRASMGSLFNVPLAWATDAAPVCAWLRERGVRLVAADVYEGELWGQEVWEGGVALFLGNEPRGLSEDVRQAVNHFVRLPIVGEAESLNVAIAGSVLMYRWLERN